MAIDTQALLDPARREAALAELRQQYARIDPASLRQDVEQEWYDPRLMAGAAEDGSDVGGWTQGVPDWLVSDAYEGLQFRRAEDGSYSAALGLGDKYDNQSVGMRWDAQGNLVSADTRDTGYSFWRGVEDMVTDDKFLAMVALVATVGAGAYATYGAAAAPSVAAAGSSAAIPTVTAGAVDGTIVGSAATAAGGSSAGAGLLSSLGISGADAAMLGLTAYGLTQSDGGGGGGDAGGPVETPVLETPDAPPSATSLDQALINQAFSAGLYGQAMQANRNPTKLVRPGESMDEFMSAPVMAEPGSERQIPLPGPGAVGAAFNAIRRNGGLSALTRRGSDDEVGIFDPLYASRNFLLGV